MCREIYIYFLLFIWIAADKITVKVKQGKIAGYREGTVFDGRLYFAFYGVPYAQPPTGALRFKNPRPVKKWKGTLDATTQFYGACAQTHIVHKHGQYGTEDCLYLNIYTPHIPRTENANLIAVIVWLHGYAFSSSFSHIFGPDFLVDKQIVLVTLSYRIGVFGFLKLNDTDSNANMGLRDIVMALKWIRKNINQFGGDKDKITVMSSGSGATFISLLMTTEASKLFSRVILHSGSIFSPSIFQGDPLTERNKLLQELKRKHLKVETASTKDIIEASHNIYIRNNREMEDLQRPIVPYTPSIEPNINTSLLVWSPHEFYDSVRLNSLYLNKPILIGYNTQESISEVIPFIHNPYYIRTFVNFFKFMVPFDDGCNYNRSSKTYKEVSSLIKDRYFKGNTIHSLESLLTYASDLLKFPILRFVKTHLSVTKRKMYMYKFDYRGKMNAVKATSIAEQKVKVSGVASGDELCYIFRCKPLWETYRALIPEKGSRDKMFIREISLLWANFAKYGNPTPNHYNTNLTWLPVNSKFDNVLLIRKYFKLVGSKEDNNMFDFWNLLYETFYKKDNCKNKHDEL